MGYDDKRSGHPEGPCWAGDIMVALIVLGVFALAAFILNLYHG